MSGREENAIELLIIERSLDAAESYITTLRNAGIAVHPRRVDHGKPLQDALDDPNLDLIFCSADIEQTAFDEKIDICLINCPEIPLIVLYRDQEPEILLQALQKGARDVVAVEDPEHMQLVVKREFRDLLVRRELELTTALLRETEARCTTLINNSHDAIAYIHEGMHILANAAYLKMFGHQDMEDIEGLPILDMIASDDLNKFKGFLRAQKAEQSQLKLRCQHSGGELFDALLEFSSASIDGESCTQVMIRETSQDGHLEQKLRQMHSQDSQTGLANRQHFLKQVHETIDTKGDSKQDDWLFYILIDNFQQIRSSTGIAASDLFLKEFAATLQEITDDETLLAHFGDHTFTILIEGGNAADAEALAKKIHQQVQEHDFSTDTGLLEQTCSIGVACLNSNIPNEQEAVNYAYHACEAVRSEGGNGTSFYDAQVMQPGSGEEGADAKLTELIRHALKNDRFRLVYQPIVSLQGDSRETYAVLSRLIDNNDKEILPEYFMGTAEQTDQMTEIDRWVVSHAISELVVQRAQGRKVSFFINLSASALKDDTFLLWICDRLREEDAKAAWLTFQIRCEDIRTHLKQAKALMQGLKKIKCLLALNRYGNDEKPGALLKHLPIDYVKYDPSLIEGLSKSQEKQDLLLKLNKEIHSYNAKSVALGVEDANSMAILWNVGADYIQGYFVQEPSENIFCEF